ncbi:MAG: hypothetical protein M1834_000406 [Cirrosporium novae-zelandiae]|nr:MAG: hypothetical protein M1834_000406 [Cirrosporium novae-zelandiae]
MPRAEAGSTKAIANKMKSKGLQRLRWYCQICERQMRDENGFKCHVQSESHVRKISVVGENSQKYLADYSRQFQNAFLLQLHTAHGEKRVQINHFYQEYIADKEHIHMNATNWSSLTQFAQHLGREGICKVDEDEKGVWISWIDRSPEALRRQEAIRKKEMLERADEEREREALKRMIQKANEQARKEGRDTEEDKKVMEEKRQLKREDGDKIKLSFAASKTSTSPSLSNGDSEAQILSNEPSTSIESTSIKPTIKDPLPSTTASKPSLFIKPKNVFASASKKKSPLFGGVKKSYAEAPKRPMSEAERIMKEEMERKRRRDQGESGGTKRIRVA